MRRGRLRLLCSVLSIIIILLLSDVCRDGRNTRERPAGFLWGIWHGWIAPISLILGILIAEFGSMRYLTTDGLMILLLYRHHKRFRRHLAIQEQEEEVINEGESRESNIL